MLGRHPPFTLDPSPEGARTLHRALGLPPEIAVDAALGDLVLEIPPAAEGVVRLNGRRLPAGRRVLLGGERIRVGRRRLRLLPPPPDRVQAGGTRTFARVALSSPVGAIAADGPALVVLEGTSAGRRWPLGQGTQTLGRGMEADVVIPEPSVSRRHAELTLGEGTIRIRDLASRHGVRVGRRRVRRPRRLRDGDEVNLGAARLRLCLPPKRTKTGTGPAKCEAAPASAETLPIDGTGPGPAGRAPPGRPAGARRDRVLVALAAALVLLGGAVSTVALAL